MAAELGFPHSCREGDAWYFLHEKKRIPLAGVGHYYALCEVYGLGAMPADARSVYFIGWKDGPIKIGVAEDAKFRLRALQVACPYELEVLAIATGGLRAEIDYHKRFKHLRLRGEWFERAPEIVEEMERLNAAA